MKKLSTRPITLQAIRKFNDVSDRIGFLEMTTHPPRGIDRRLLTISTTLLTTLRAIDRDGHMPPRAVVAAYRQALNTDDGADQMRVLIVADWALRCAVPLWISKAYGPATMRPALLALQELDRMPVMLWNDPLATAVRALVSKRMAIDVLQRVTMDEKERRAGEMLSTVLGEGLIVATHALQVNLKHRLDSDYFAPAFAIGMMRPRWLLSDVQLKQMRASLPKLLAVLLSVKPGESREAVAPRCAWAPSATLTKRRRAA